jgi:hypothetical protein
MDGFATGMSGCAACDVKGRHTRGNGRKSSAITWNVKISNEM